MGKKIMTYHFNGVRGEVVDKCVLRVRLPERKCI